MGTWETAPAATDLAEALDDPNVVSWERLEGETAKAFAAFEAYRDMGHTRSVPKVIELGHPGTCNKWSAQNFWVERSRRYDVHLSRVRQDAYINGIEEMAHRHAKAAKGAIRALMAPIDEINRRLQDEPNRVREELEIRPTHQLVEVAQASARALQPVMNAERLALGMPTDISQKDEEHVHRIDFGDPERLTATLEALAGTGILDAVLAERGIGEVIDAEVYEVDPDHSVAEANSLPARTA